MRFLLRLFLFSALLLALILSCGRDGRLCSGDVCNDGNACTEDSCDPVDGRCEHTPHSLRRPPTKRKTCASTYRIPQQKPAFHLARPMHLRNCT